MPYKIILFLFITNKSWFPIVCTVHTEHSEEKDSVKFNKQRTNRSLVDHSFTNTVYKHCLELYQRQYHGGLGGLVLPDMYVCIICHIKATIQATIIDIKNRYNAIL